MGTLLCIVIVTLFFSRKNEKDLNSKIEYNDNEMTAGAAICLSVESIRVVDERLWCQSWSNWSC